jgi:hypothetical protein
VGAKWRQAEWAEGSSEFGQRAHCPPAAVCAGPTLASDTTSKWNDAVKWTKRPRRSRCGTSGPRNRRAAGNSAETEKLIPQAG